MTTPNTKTRTKRVPAAKEPVAAEQQPAVAALPKGKLGLLVGLLQRPEGATIAALADATGWQDHSIRGALAGALKKRGFVVTSERIDGIRTYRLTAGTPEAES